MACMSEQVRGVRSSLADPRALDRVGAGDVRRTPDRAEDLFEVTLAKVYVPWQLPFRRHRSRDLVANVQHETWPERHHARSADGRNGRGS